MINHAVCDTAFLFSQMYFAHLFVLKQGNALDVTKAIKSAAVAVSRVASTEVKASAHAARLAKNESQGSVFVF